MEWVVALGISLEGKKERGKITRLQVKYICIMHRARTIDKMISDAMER